MIARITIRGVEQFGIIEPARQYQDVSEVEAVEQVEAIYEALNSLKEVYREILALRYGLYGQEPHTLQWIADSMGIAKQTLEAKEKRALKAMRQLLTD